MVKTKITEDWVENKDYRLIPKENDFWHVEILKGDYSSCIISYSKVSVNEDTMVLKFEYNLEYSPVDYIKAGELELDRTASHILHSILMSALDAPEKK
jgi:hypothetical protein